jgi:hypothetical protein
MAEPSGEDPRQRAGDGEVDGETQEIRTDLRAQPPKLAGQRPRLWGTRPGRLGVFVIVCGTTLGFVVTVLADREPGLLLGVFLLVSTVLAAFAVRPRAAYLIIPVPALAYLVAAVVAGLIHDRATDTSRTALVISAVQWIASGFFVMTAATAIAIAVAAARWLVSRRARQGLWRPSPAGAAEAYPAAQPASSQPPAADDPAAPGLPAGPRHPA